MHQTLDDHCYTNALLIEIRLCQITPSKVAAVRAFVLVLFVLSLSSLVRAEEPKNLLRPVANESSWNFEQVSPAAGSIKTTEREVHFSVTACDGNDWHVQVFQWDLDLEEGASYTVKFKARSTDQRGYSLRASVTVDDYHEIGLREELFASKHFRQESVTFTVRGVAPGKNRIGFVLGDEKGTLIIKDMTLTRQ